MTGNAVFSALTGLVVAFGSGRLDDWLGVDARLLVLLGVGLVVYALDLVWSTRSPDRLAIGGRVAVAADAGWVVGAVALVAATDVLTPSGETDLVVVTLVVAGLAVAQWIGLRRLDRETG